MNSKRNFNNDIKSNAICNYINDEVTMSTETENSQPEKTFEI